MKTIRIFLASSEELENDRNAFGNLIRKLNKTYQMRGIELDLFEWEDYDAAYNDRRKQDEYNEKVRASDMFLAVFHIKAGRFTCEEFDVAIEEFRRRGLPKSYVYCKDLKDDEVESQELKEFKERLYNELGHYWSRYSNRDTMQLHFVMQLQLVEGCNSNSLKVEDSQVKVDQLVVAHLDNIPFAADNERYRALREQLQELNEYIADLESSAPLSADKEQRLNKKKQKRNEIREKLQEHEQFLLDAAVRVAQYTGERISERMKRAIELFNEGKVSEANAVLDEAERDADQILQGVKELKAVGKQSVDELLVKASYMLADEKYTIEERVEKTHSIYQKALELATECGYEEEKLYRLLYDYCDFLIKYAKYDEALEIAKQCVELSEKLYGDNHGKTADSYDNIGIVYHCKGDYDTALKNYNKALAIRQQVLGENHPSTAASYNNIGVIYRAKGDYDKALEYYKKALAIFQQVFGENHPSTAASHNNIGLVYDDKGNYDTALEYYNKALDIKKQVLGENHPDTAISYNNIGNAYDSLGDYDTALEYHNKALAIRQQVLGENHPDTATSYNNIGIAYHCKGDHDTALDNYNKALVIKQQVLGENHPDTADSYNNIGAVYGSKGDYDTALEYYNKALDIRKQVLGENHPDTATSYNNIGCAYYNKGDYDTALDNYNKALDIRKQVLGENHPHTATLYGNIRAVYAAKGKSVKAHHSTIKGLWLLLSKCFRVLIRKF